MEEGACTNLNPDGDDQKFEFLGRGSSLSKNIGRVFPRDTPASSRREQSRALGTRLSCSPAGSYDSQIWSIQLRLADVGVALDEGSMPPGLIL